MPNPFPGIDPYIEAQGYWPDFHASFLIYLREALFARLPERYEAVIDESCQLVEVDEDRPQATQLAVRPDVAILDRGADRIGAGWSAATGGAAVLEPAIVPFAKLQERRHTWIEIHRRPDHELVTVIELLSPANKSGSGRGAYLAKRVACLRQPVHLVELDFLLSGPRLPMGAPLPPGDFYAFVARTERLPDAEVYVWLVRTALSSVPIPLKAPDPDVIVDLAEVYATTHERGRYARRLDYSRPLTLPLRPEDRAWAEDLARKAAR